MLRDKGTMKGKLVSDISNLGEILKEIEDYKIVNSVETVSRKQTMNYGLGRQKQIALIDYGAKDNIVNCLLKRGVSVVVYPSYSSRWNFIVKWTTEIQKTVKKKLKL